MGWGGAVPIIIILSRLKSKPHQPGSFCGLYITLPNISNNVTYV